MADDTPMATPEQRERAEGTTLPPHAPGWNDQEIHDAFHYHPPSQEGVDRHAALSAAFTGLCTLLRDVCPPGRERACAKTALEEAKFWASAAVARNPDTR